MCPSALPVPTSTQPTRSGVGGPARRQGDVRFRLRSQGGIEQGDGESDQTPQTHATSAHCCDRSLGKGPQTQCPRARTTTLIRAARVVPCWDGGSLEPSKTRRAAKVVPRPDTRTQQLYVALLNFASVSNIFNGRELDQHALFIKRNTRDCNCTSHRVNQRTHILSNLHIEHGGGFAHPTSTATSWSSPAIWQTAAECRRRCGTSAGRWPHQPSTSLATTTGTSAT